MPPLIPWSEVGEIGGKLASWATRGMGKAAIEEATSKASGGFWRPAMTVLQDMEYKSGAPIYSKYAKSIVSGVERATEQASTYDIGAMSKMKGFRHSDYQDAMEVVFGRTFDAKPRDIKISPDKLERASRAFVETLEPQLKSRGVSVKDYAASIRQLRKFNTPTQAFPNGLPDHLRIFNNVYVNAHEPNMAHFIAQHNRAFAMEEHVDAHAKDLASYVTGEGLKVIGPARRDYVLNWIGQATGRNRDVNRAFSPLLTKALGYVGIKPDAGTVSRYVSTANTLLYANLVGGRPAAMTKNLFNSFQTAAPRIGIQWWWRGVKQAMTKEGAELASKAGMTGKIEEELRGLHLAMDAGEPVQAAIHKFSHYMMKPYSTIDDWNRSHVYLAMRARVLDAIKRTNGRQEFLEAAALDHFHPIIQNEVIDALKKEGPKAAADVAGKWAAYNTQWNYSAPYKPSWLSGEKAKLLFQFGVWPANYADYMHQMITLPMSRASRARWVTETMAVNAAIAGAFGLAGAAAGVGGIRAAVETTTWTGVGPLNYDGGVLLSAVPALGKASYELTESTIKRLETGQGSISTPTGAQAAADIGRTMVPGYGITRDIAKAKGRKYYPSRLLTGGDVFPEDKNVAPSADMTEAMFRITTGNKRSR